MDSAKPLLTTINLKVQSSSDKIDEIEKAFQTTFDLYESLFNLVTDEGHYMVADPLRHPIIFYLAHTSVFYVNKLITAGIIN